MGAFFLYNKTTETNLCLDDARRVFARKGFAEPRMFELGDMRLWLYQKQLVDTPNFVEHENGGKLFAIGTVAYRGLGYRDSLQRLLHDLTITNQLDLDKIIGSFCILHWDGMQVRLIRDQSDTFHVFTYDNGNCLSSSFLAMVAASPQPLPLNTHAVLEKLASGFIIAPDTPVKGINILDSRLQPPTGICSNDKIQVTNPPSLPPTRDHEKDFTTSIQSQVELLRTHFQALNGLNNEYGGELGMSSGYDSRLVLACANFLDSPIALHTHATEGAHEIEGGIVEKIAHQRNLELTRIPTKAVKSMRHEEVERTMLDSLYHFDGRSSRQRGAFHVTYTGSYRKQVLNNTSRLGFNGIGGELYRNDTCSRFDNLDFNDWFALHVYFPFTKEVFGNNDLFAAMHAHVKQKLARMFDHERIEDKVALRLLRRYYSEVRGCNSDANIVNAQNQISFFHAPFLDAKLIAEGIAATHFMTPGPKYETELIRTIDPELASYSSSYGYAFSHIPLRHQVKYWIKSRMPERTLLNRVRRKLMKTANQNSLEYSEFAKLHPFLNEIRDILQQVAIHGNYDIAMSGDEQRRTTLFFGAFLREFQDKLKFSNQ